MRQLRCAVSSDQIVRSGSHLARLLLGSDSTELRFNLWTIILKGRVVPPQKVHMSKILFSAHLFLTDGATLRRRI